MKWTLLALMIVTTTAAWCQPVVVDQEYFGTGGSFTRPNTTLYNPIGQSFTPQLTSISFLSIYGLTNATNPSLDLNSTFQITLHSGTDPNEDLLATSPLLESDSIMFSQGAPPFTIVWYEIQPLEWYFDSPVSLIPGNTYSFYLYLVSGDDYTIDLHPSNFPESASAYYPGGTALIDGLDTSNESIHFSEGIAIPEPKTHVLLLLGLLLIHLRNRTRALTQGLTRYAFQP